MSEKKHTYKVGDFYDDSMINAESNSVSDTMNSICYKVEDTSYSKILSEADLIEKKEMLAEVSIQLDELAERKKELISQLKNEFLNPTIEKAEILKAIKFKSEQRKGILFYVDFQEEGMMYIFDDQAICIEARKLRSDEKQTKIKILKTGTDE